jgi:tRNA pseudouridine55 synthase
LLVVLVGRATRLARFIEGTEKCYDAVVRLGMSTDTDDATGTVIREVTPAEWPTSAQVAEAAKALVGRQLQVPPAYSAKHVAGTRSYALARSGRAVELAPVEVMVHALDVMGWTPPTLAMHARVGRGTYIRSLARDLGERLALPAHCAELRRTSIGPFGVQEALAPDAVTAAALVPPAAMLRHLWSEVVGEDTVHELGFGRAVVQQVAHEGTGALIAGDGRLVAVAEGRDGEWHPVVVLEPAA